MAHDLGFEESADCSAVRYESLRATEIKIYFNIAHCDIFISVSAAVQTKLGLLDVPCVQAVLHRGMCRSRNIFSES